MCYMVSVVFELKERGVVTQETECSSGFYCAGGRWSGKRVQPRMRLPSPWLELVWFELSTHTEGVGSGVPHQLAQV